MSKTNTSVRVMRQLADICDSGATVRLDCILCRYQVTVYPDGAQDVLNHFHLEGKDLHELIGQAHEKLKLNSEDFEPR